MNRRTTLTRRLLTATTVAVLSLGLGAGPVAATEAETPADAPAEDHGSEVDDGKIELPLDTNKPRDAAGILILAVSGALVLVAAMGMRRQLKGEHDQATGEWRYR